MFKKLLSNSTYSIYKHTERHISSSAKVSDIVVIINDIITICRAQHCNDIIDYITNHI